MTIHILSRVAAFAAVFGALCAAHTFGDHWYGQTHRQALGKGARTLKGALSCLAHVALLTLHKVAFLAILCFITGMRPFVPFVAGALLVDAVSHYWADRRFTLKWLAEHTGKGEFYRLGVPREGHDDAHHLGTGAYAMDQSWHHAWLFVAALIIAAGV